MAEDKESKRKKSAPKKIRPASSPENRENQMIALAMDQAEHDLLNGTASSQVVTHFLKLGTAKAKLENEKLKAENELLKVKAENIRFAEQMDEMYSEVLKAMTLYRGSDDE